MLDPFDRCLFISKMLYLLIVFLLHAFNVVEADRIGDILKFQFHNKVHEHYSSVVVVRINSPLLLIQSCSIEK